MKRIALLGLAIAAIGLTACTKRTEVTSNMSISVNGQQSSWKLKCKQNDVYCSPNSIANARTMHMGDGLYYTCSITGELYMSRESYRAMTNLEPVKGATCDFSVSTK